MVKSIKCAICGTAFLSDNRSLCLECSKREADKTDKHWVDQTIKIDVDCKKPFTEGLRQAAMSGGDKFDDNPYDKIDLSLIPLSIFKTDFKDDKGWEIFREVHCILNGKRSPSIIPDLFYRTISKWGFHDLAVSLGYGVEKYERNNWKKGFGGDYQRMLRACLRHLLWMFYGAQYDGEPYGKYDRGNPHKGAVQFTLMVAMYEYKTTVEQSMSDAGQGVTNDTP